MKKRTLITATAACLVGATALAQDSGQYVPKEKYDQLLKEFEQMKKDMQEFRQFKEQVQQKGLPPAQPATPGATNVVSADIQRDLDTTREMAKKSFPGTDKMLLTGYGSAGFTSARTENKAFNAQFNPIFLWKVSDRLLFEGEVEMELENGDTSTALEIAQLSYVVNDYMTIGAGKFLNPMNSFVERYHMAWVNRLPDKPLAVYDGLLPETYVGAQVRGGIPLGSTKINYAVFAANAPSLTTTVDDPTDLSELGTLQWDNFSNEGDHIAFGGHIGFQPVPEFEVGYGIHYSEVGPKGSKVEAFLHSVDASYVRDSETLRGVLRLNAQWVWSDVDKYVFDAGGGQGFGPLAFDNTREGGYAQLTYRPTHIAVPFIRDLEGVFRYDVLNQRRTPVGFNEDRYTVGLNYWLTPMTVLKAAYQWDHRKTSGENNADAFLLQFATGF